MSGGAASRLVAAVAVQVVLTRQDALEVALSGQPAFHALEARDRAFTRLVTATTFRRMGQIDAVLKPFLKRLPAPLAHAILRTGAAQILFLQVPGHAAVGESVGALRRSGQTPGYAGLINAVLRRVVESGPAAGAAHPPKVNIPGWIRGEWERAYGAPAMRKMAAQLMKSPPLDISVKSDPASWAQRLGGTLLPSGTVRLDAIGDVTARDGYADGAWWAQDIAASLPVKAMGDVSGLDVLDMCAAPGGKTLQLANAGARVTALDKSDRRLDRLRENLARTRLEAAIVVEDALDYTPAKAFDAVLLDAPCSATGTYRRHPDVLYNKTPKTVSTLIKLQDKLIAKAATLVKPGGTLIYCTCSLQPGEGEARLVQTLKTQPEFRLNRILTTKLADGDDDPLGIAETNGHLRSLPHYLGGMDGFFVARLQRVAG